MTQTLELQNKVVKLIPAIEVKAFDGIDGGDDGYPRVKFVASATTVDLYGDQLTVEALQQMAEQFRTKTSFIDHVMILKEVFGIIEDCQVEARTLVEPMSGIEAPHHVLVITVKVAKSSPQAMHVYNLIKDGVNVGASVTIYILDSHPIDGGVNQISKVYGLEVSACGIPANQNAWVEQLELAIKAYQSKNGSGDLPPNPAQLINQVKEKKAMPKSTIRRKASYRRMARKNVFDEILAANATATCGDLCQGLCQAIDSALQEADGGGMDDPAGAIKQLLSDFTDAVMSQVQPALDAMASETPEDETEEAESGAGDDTSTASDGADDSEVEKAFKRVKAFLAYRKAKKDTTDWLDPNNGDNTTPDATAPDDDFAQTVHDMCVSKGATCMGIGDPDKPVDEMDMGDLQGYRAPRGTVKHLKANNLVLFKRAATAEKKVAELQEEIEYWEAVGPVLKQAVKALKNQPIKA